MNMGIAFFKDNDFQEGICCFAADMLQKIETMDKEKRLIYKAELAICAARNGNSNRIDELAELLLAVRSQMSDYRFNKVLKRLSLSKHAAKEIMKIGVRDE